MSAQPHRMLTRGPCGKAIYLSRDEARRVVDGYRRRKPKERLSVYHCRLCGGWHFTSHPGQRLRPAREVR